MQLKVFHLRRSRFAPLYLIIIITFSGIATPARTAGTRLIGSAAASLERGLWPIVKVRHVVMLQERRDWKCKKKRGEKKD